MEEEKKNQENEIVQMEESITENKPVNAINENISQVEPPKKNNGLVGILVFIIILLVGGLVYVLFFMKSNDTEGGNGNGEPTPTVTPVPSEQVTPTPTVTPVPSEQVTPTPSVTPTEKPTGDYELTVYKYKDDGRVSSYNKESENIEAAFTIKVSSKDAKVLAVDMEGQFLIYNDNGIVIYNVQNKSIERTKLSGNYNDYDFYINEQNNKVIGISFRDTENRVGYYNVSLGKELYYNKNYIKDDYPFIEQVNDKYIALSTDDYAYLLNANEEKEEKVHKYTEKEGDWYSYWGKKIGNKYIYVFGACIDECVIFNMYDSNLKEFYNGSVSDTEYSVYKDKIYILNNNVIEQYNDNGELIKKSSNEYKNVRIITDGYVVYMKDNNIVLENIDDTSETKQIIMEEGSYLDDYMTGYYSRSKLDEMKEYNKKEGFYIVIYYGNKDSKGNYGMEYCYNKGEELVEYPIKKEMGGRAKPVLYLYPEEETNVKVEFAHPEYLTTTYPKYNGSWEVTAKHNGDMYDKDGKYYYALYWDETRYSETDFKEGFYVESSDAIKFLEEKLTIIGLNDKERNEFIMYWLPIMEANGKNLVYFELTEEREKDNKLIITPTPDSLLRVSIHIKKVNEKTSIKEQKLPTFNRSGFTAVEWGGMTY